MSGSISPVFSQTPQEAKVLDPWAGIRNYESAVASQYEPAQAFYNAGKTQQQIPLTQAQTTQTLAQAAKLKAETGLIGTKTTGAGIQNQLSGLNLQLQAPIIQQQINALTGAGGGQKVSLPWAPLPDAGGGAADRTGGGVGSPGAAGPAGVSASPGGAVNPGGAPPAIGPGAAPTVGAGGQSGGNAVPGPAGYLSGAGGGGGGAGDTTASLPPVTTGDNGVMVPGMGVPMPRQWYIGYLQAQDKPAAMKQIMDSRKALISQMVQGTMGQDGKVDPGMWNQAVKQAYDSGLITSTDAWNYYSHPDKAMNAVNANLPAGDLPAVRGAQTAATAGAQAGVENQNMIETRTVETSPGIYQPVSKTRAQWLQDGGSQAPVVTPSSVSDALIGTEASGPNATSPKGAKGTAQIMQGTFNQYALPGESYSNEKDRVRVANRVVDDLWRKYPNDPQRVAVGYFSGPGNIAPPSSQTPWVADNNDGNMNVSQYVQRFNQKLAGVTGAGGGAAGGPTAGAAAVGPPTPTVAQEKGMSKDVDMIGADQKMVQDTQTGALRAQAAMFNIYDALKTLPAASPGAFGTQRTALANVLQTFAPEWANKFLAATTNIDPSKAADMQKFTKELFQNTVGAETSGLPGARYGAMLTQFFTNATPNINMQGDAIKDMLHIMLVGQQMVRDYSQGAAGHFNNSYGAWRSDPLTGQYTPMTSFDEKWTAPGAVSAPNVYEGAAQLLNGKGYGDWSKGMSPEQQTEAVRVAHRADPAWRPVRGQGNAAPAAPAPAAPAPVAPPAGVTANATPG